MEQCAARSLKGLEDVDARLFRLQCHDQHPDEGDDAAAAVIDCRAGDRTSSIATIATTMTPPSHVTRGTPSGFAAISTTAAVPPPRSAHGSLPIGASRLPSAAPAMSNAASTTNSSADAL